MSDDYTVVPRDMFKRIKMPRLTITPDGIKYNKAVYENLGGKQRFLVFLNQEKRKLAVVLYDQLGCLVELFPESDGWDLSAIKVDSEDLSRKIYSLMDWKKDYKYEVSGILSIRKGIESLFLNLGEP